MKVDDVVFLTMDFGSISFDEVARTFREEMKRVMPHAFTNSHPTGLD